MRGIVGGTNSEELKTIQMDTAETHKTNGVFWDTVGSEFLGVTALPQYGAFLSEDKLHLLDQVKKDKVLEIGCGNGHSMEYMFQKGVRQLWGLDISQKQDF